MTTATVTWDDESHTNMTQLADYLGISLSDLLATIGMNLPAMAINAAVIQRRLERGTVPRPHGSGIVHAICSLLDRDNLQAICHSYNPTQE